MRPTDLLPVIAYIFEIYFGIYLIYWLDRMRLTGRISGARKKLTRLLSACSGGTTKAVAAWGKAEAEGVDPFVETVTEDLHKCFYRNNKHVADERSYVTDGKRELKTVSVELVSTSGGYPTFSEVTLLTEYLFTASAVTDSNHVCTFRFETYENDMVKRLRISHGGNTIEKEVSLDIDSGGPHRVMIS
jgi:hypothetical protein